MKKVAVCCGVRPDIIKMAPVYHALRDLDKTETLLCYSSQHDEMGKQMLKVFSLSPDHYLNVPQFENRSLSWLTAKLLEEFHLFFLAKKPELVLVHGDNATGFSAALAAYYLKIPIGHVEAGLRTSRFETPNPEEGIRRMISRISTLHFAPTQIAKENLMTENITNNVFVTGNTIIDALHMVLDNSGIIRSMYEYTKQMRGTKNILVTCHRRENWGIPIINLCNTLKKIINLTPKTEVFFPVHDNPDVKNIVNDCLGSIRNVTLASSVPYDVFLRRLKDASLVITDSGGVIEEAVTLGKPTIVLRSEIERPEALQLKGVKLVGNDFKLLEQIACKWLKKAPEGQLTTVFGNGQAGNIIANIVCNYLEDSNGKSN